jgi:hypothetical protein
MVSDSPSNHQSREWGIPPSSFLRKEFPPSTPSTSNPLFSPKTTNNIESLHSLMAGEVASLLLSRMADPILFYIPERES